MEKLSEEQMFNLIDAIPINKLAPFTQKMEIIAAWKAAGYGIAPAETPLEKARREWEDIGDGDGWTPYTIRSKAVNYIAALLAEIDRLKSEMWTEGEVLQYANYRKDCYRDEVPFDLPNVWLAARRAAKEKE